MDKRKILIIIISVLIFIFCFVICYFVIFKQEPIDNETTQLVEENETPSYEISIVDVKPHDGVTDIMVEIKNVSSEKINFKNVNLVFKDDSGNEITSISNMIIDIDVYGYTMISTTFEGTIDNISSVELVK